MTEGKSYGESEEKLHMALVKNMRRRKQIKESAYAKRVG